MFPVMTFILGLAVGGVGLLIFVTYTLGGLKQSRREAEARTREADALKREADGLLEQYRPLVAELSQNKISCQELQHENAVMRLDLRNAAINLEKVQLDGDARDRTQKEVDGRSQEMSRRYLADAVKWIGGNLTFSNFAASKTKLLDVITRCRGIGFPISVEEEHRLVGDLKTAYERVVREQVLKEEQAKIKAQVREDERLQREVARVQDEARREEAAIKIALAKALEAANNEHTEEVQRLQARLAEAEEKSRRAMSMAQQTKAGNVYVISNIGSFGEGVFKIGMTRRLEPNERIKELCGASVPFPFDVHFMIASKDAPSLENQLHKKFHRTRINRANPRKEFFKATLDEIMEVVKARGDELKYVYTPETPAEEYHQSLAMSKEDADFIESVYQKIEDEEEATVVSEE
jgi:hypothetical protein